MNLQTEISNDLWAAVARSYSAGLFSNAILDAMHFLSNVIRERANLDGDGAGLVGQALGGDSPLLRINPFQTETERTEQKGFENILRGLYIGIRNPRSHEQHEDSQQTADVVIAFIGYCIEVVGRAKTPFSLSDWEMRAFDQFFVANDRYAELLVAEVPTNKLFDALLVVYRNKLHGDGSKLSYIVKKLIEKLEPERTADFFRIVSEELQISSSEDVIIAVLSIIDASYWPRVGESARLRIENRIIQSVRHGSVSNGSVTHGALATWARDHFRYFVLQDDLARAFLGKLTSSDDQLDYVAAEFLQALDGVGVGGHPYLSRYYRNEMLDALSAAVLKGRSEILRNKLVAGVAWSQEWREEFLKRIEPLKTTSPLDYQAIADNGVPF